jgi:hypothetical protein
VPGSLMAVSPEFRLAAACATWPPSDRRIEAIRAAAANAVDWPRFLRVARRHQVIGLVHDGLTRVQPDMPPYRCRSHCTSSIRSFDYRFGRGDTPSSIVPGDRSQVAYPPRSTEIRLTGARLTSGHSGRVGTF